MDNISIPRLVDRIAKSSPDAKAIQNAHGAFLSYACLSEQIYRVVSALNQSGLGRNDRVAIALPNGPEMAVAFLAVASGATCAPLNPAYCMQEFKFYLSDLNAKALILPAGSSSPARAVAQLQNIPIFELIPLPDAAGGFSLIDQSGKALLKDQTAEPVFAEAEGVALVLHTSGTTAQPKIVPLTHRNLCCSADNIRQTLQLSQQDCCLNVMPLFHIHGLIGCLLSSLTAAASVVCTEGFNADQFLSWLRQCQPTWYSAVPTMHQAVLAQAQQNGIPEVPLRFIRSSSAAMSACTMAEIEALFGVPVIEAYGMTEASHQMTSNPLPPARRKSRSVGRANQTDVAIAAVETNRLLPQGEIGEVVIRGEAVTQGYAGNPIANATAFFDGWFRTGDQGYLDEDGYLFLQGRLKEMINRGGEKISPLEIDEALMERPEVHQAVAFAVPHPSLGEDLVAAVVLKPAAEITPEALRDYLLNNLADFKVPSQIILVDAIPKGATGKLQRIGLAAKLANQLQGTFVAPRNAIERTVAEIMAQILGREQIGVEENFFILGGDSLKGTQVASRLAQKFGINLPNVVIFRRPTVVQLASEIAELIQLNVPDNDLHDLVNDLQALSSEEVAQLLEAAEGS